MFHLARHGCCVLPTMALILLAQSAMGASAGSNVTIRPEAQPQIDFPGVGGSNLSFASGTLTRGNTTATGSASAGGGYLTAFAVASSTGAAHPDSRRLDVTATSALNDSFTVTADTTLPLKLEFGMRATGSVSTVYGANRWQGFGPSAKVRWSVTAGAAQANGFISEGYSPVLIGGILMHQVVRSQTGLGFTEFALVMDLGSGTLGQTYGLSMSASAFANTRVAPVGVSFSGLADFGSTLRWMGLKKVTHLDGSPFTGAIQIVSESGHDYLTLQASCVGDLNSDDQVDDSDFQIFVVAYDILDCADLAMPQGCPSDLNTDDFVDDLDFQLFVGAYDQLLCP